MPTRPKKMSPFSTASTSSISSSGSNLRAAKAITRMDLEPIDSLTTWAFSKSSFSIGTISPSLNR